MALFSEVGTMHAAAAGLEAVTTGLATGVTQIQATGAAVAPPGADGASMAAAAQQKESQQLFAAALFEGLSNLSTGIPMTTAAASAFDAEDVTSSAALSTV